jgi:phage shock protein A
MALITRLSRLFRADVHAVLDRLEEPDVLLRQAIREMEDEIARGARQLEARELERQQAEGRLAGIRRGLQAIAGELDLCFGANNEALIRTLLRRRLEGERLAHHLDQRVAQLGQQIEAQRRTLDEQRRRLDELRQKAAIFEHEPGRDERGNTALWSAEDFAVTDADVDLALLRERQQRRVP